MKRKWIPSVFCAALLTGFPFLPCAVAQDDPPSPVTTETVGSASLPHTIELPGTITARRSSAVSVEVDGLVAEVLVDEGDLVTEGQPMLRLRATPAQLTLDSARAELARAEARARLATLREQRNAELRAAQMVPEESYDVATAELRQSEAELAGARAQLALAQDRLERHLVRAPFAGVVGEKRTEAGAWVRAGEIVATLEELDTVRVRFALPQVHYAKVGNGTSVSFRSDALPAEKFTAPVTTKVRVGSSSARTFPVLVDIANPEGHLAPGMSVNVTVQLSDPLEATTHPTVSADSIVHRPDGSELVWRVAGNGEATTVQPVPVITGRRFEDRVEILQVLQGELPSGARVVVQGNENLRPGQPVRFVQ